MSGGWEVSGGVVADDIGGTEDEGVTEEGRGEGDGVGSGREVEGGDSDEVGEDIGGVDAGGDSLLVDVGGGLKEKINQQEIWAGV